MYGSDAAYCDLSEKYAPQAHSFEDIQLVSGVCGDYRSFSRGSLIVVSQGCNFKGVQPHSSLTCAQCFLWDL